MNTKTTTKISIQHSKRGLPCLWEQGGGMTNTGHALTISDNNGFPKKPIHIQHKGHLACGQHALIPIVVNDHVCKANHHRGDFTLTIYRIVAIDNEKQEAEMVEINRFSESEWEKEGMFSEGKWNGFSDMVSATKRKAGAYHCRSPYYIKGESER